MREEKKEGRKKEGRRKKKEKEEGQCLPVVAAVFET